MLWAELAPNARAAAHSVLVADAYGVDRLRFPKARLSKPGLPERL